MLDRPGGNVGRLGTFRSPVVIAMIAGIGLAAPYVVAVQRSVPDWELDLTTWLNGRPGAVADVIVREGDGAGLGYISGHSALAASAAVMAPSEPAAAVAAAALTTVRVDG